MSAYHFDFRAEEKKIGECVRDVLTIKNCRRAMAFISPKKTVKATAQRRLDKRDRSATILVTVGAPNFLERRLIRSYQKSGVVFPLNQIHHKFWPKKKR